MKPITRLGRSARLNIFAARTEKQETNGEQHTERLFKALSETSLQDRNQLTRDLQTYKSICPQRKRNFRFLHARRGKKPRVVARARIRAAAATRRWNSHLLRRHASRNSIDFGKDLPLVVVPQEEEAILEEGLRFEAVAASRVLFFESLGNIVAIVVVRSARDETA